MRSLTIDGVKYRDLSAAAAAIGLTRRQLADRLRNGGRRPPYTAAGLAADLRTANRKDTARRERLRAWLQDPARPTLAAWAREEGISRQRAMELAAEPEFAALVAARKRKAQMESKETYA